MNRNVRSRTKHPNSRWREAPFKNASSRPRNEWRDLTSSRCARGWNNRPNWRKHHSPLTLISNTLQKCSLAARNESKDLTSSRCELGQDNRSNCVRHHPLTHAHHQFLPLLTHPSPASVAIVREHLLYMPATLEKVRTATLDAYTTAATASREAVNRSIQFMGRNVVSTICSVVALGALAAWALSRRMQSRRPTRRTRKA